MALAASLGSDVLWPAPNHAPAGSCGLFQRAPYSHDGGAAPLMDVVDHDDAHFELQLTAIRVSADLANARRERRDAG